MMTLLKDHPELIDVRLRALYEPQQLFLHDLATDIEAAYQKGREEGRNEVREKRRVIMVETLMQILTKRLNDIPQTISDKLHTIHDHDALNQLTDVALNCQSLDEFEAALRK